MVYKNKQKRIQKKRENSAIKQKKYEIFIEILKTLKIQKQY